MLHKIFTCLLFFTLLFNQPNLSAGSITAKSWLISDIRGNIIDGENIDVVRPIASITKLLTVMVVLDANQDVNEKITMTTKLADKLPRNNQKLTRLELINLTITASDNRAALTLCENYPGGLAECVQAMNQKIRSLEMTNTVVYEPTGLDARNVSTARQLIKLTREASFYGNIRYASRKSEIKIEIKNKWFVFRNTNPLIGTHQNILVSKTGYISASGGCITLFLDTNIGDRIVVVLGSKNTRTRIPEAEFLSNMYRE